MPAHDPKRDKEEKAAELLRGRGWIVQSPYGRPALVPKGPDAILWESYRGAQALAAIASDLNGPA